MLQKSSFIYIMLLLLCCNYAKAINSNNLKDEVTITPFVHSFMKEDYHAERQNWDVSCAESGKVYFANSQGLLSYDGESWNLYPTSTIMRAVYCSNDTIYVGGNGFMGYYLEERIEDGIHLISDIENDVWKIYPFQESIVFQAFDRFYLFDQENKIHIERIRKGNTTFSYPIEDKIYFQTSYNQLNTFAPNESETVWMDNPILRSLLVKAIHPLGGDTLLLGTLNKGLFIAYNNQITRLDNQVNDYLIKNKLNKILPLSKHGYAFATMNGGVIIGKLDGEIQSIINRSNGLSNNRIHALGYQDEQNLWISTDNGISLVSLATPIQYFYNHSNELGSFYDAIQWRGDLYFGTNHGLFRAFKKETKDVRYGIELVKGSEGQILNLEVIDDMLWVGHNNGAFVVDQNGCKPISRIAGGYTLIQSKRNPDIAYQSSYYGMAIYKRKAGKWALDYTVKDIRELTRDIIELSDGSLVVSGSKSKLFHLHLDHERKGYDVNSLKEHRKIVSASSVRAFDLKGRALVITNNQAYYYDQSGFSPAPELFYGATYVSEVVDDHVFVRKNNRLTLFNLSRQEAVELDYNLSEIENNLIFKYENISLLNNGKIAFCMADKVAFCNLSELLQSKRVDRQPIITEIWVSNDRAGESYQFLEDKEIPFDLNTIQIEFSALNYGGNTQYETMLEGYNKEWQVRDRNYIEFQNLSEGTYQFLVREKNGTLYDHVTFTITPPIYRSTKAYLLYILIVIASIVISRYCYIQWKKRRRYLQKLKERKRENEKRMMLSKNRLDNEVKRLQEEVSNSSGKVTNLLLQNSKKKDMIEQINEELKCIKEQPFNNNKQIDKLLKVIKMNFDEQKDWMQFEAAFTETHSTFFKKLKSQHPILTDEDLRLCAYLKVNLSSKELAPILQITTRSVDLKKYRLKKKLNLTKEQSLKQYILEFDE